MDKSNATELEENISLSDLEKKTKIDFRNFLF